MFSGSPLLFHPALAETVDRFPITTIAASENKFDILQTVSKNRHRPAPLNSQVHLPCIVCPPFLVPVVREEFTNFSSSPAECRHKKWDLNLVAWMNETGVIDGTSCDGDFNELFFAKQVFLFSFVDNYSLRPQSVPYPLGQSRC